MTSLCDYCKARLPADDEHSVAMPKRTGVPTPVRSGVRGESYWLVHKRCVSPAIAHLRFITSHRPLH